MSVRSLSRWTKEAAAEPLRRGRPRTSAAACAAARAQVEAEWTRQGRGCGVRPIAVYLCEPKRADMLADAEVLAKAKVAVEWCDAATKPAAANSGKPWTYLLIPHDAIQANMTLAGLASQFGRGAG